MTLRAEGIDVLSGVQNSLVTEIYENVDNGGDLHILDRDEGWQRRPWADVVESAEALATRLVAEQRTDRPGTVAVISEASYETMSVLAAAWMAGRATTVLPGPNRFASLDSWAQRTAAEMAGRDVEVVFTHGTALKALDVCNRDSGALVVRDLSMIGELPSAPAVFKPVLRPAGEPAILQGTAGSTGNPKCVELTADAAVHQVRAVQQRVHYQPGYDSWCIWLPLYHDMGLLFSIGGLISGEPLWLAPTSAFARSPLDWLAWLDHSQATTTAGPDFAYALMGRYAHMTKKADLGRLRNAISGGEPIDVEATQRFGQELARYGFDPQGLCPSYGLAEATCALTMPADACGLQVDEVAGKAGVRRAALLGTPIDGAEVRIMPSGHRTDFDDVRDVGEVEFRSPGQMIGYRGETPIVAGEWIKTGDLGYLHNGQLVVCGRSKELITIAGRNIFPQEIERVAAEVPGVRLGCVAAVSGKGSGTRRDQLIVVAEYSDDDSQGTRRAIIEKVAAECGIAPGSVDFVEAGALPKTTSGKLRRVDIAARYR